MPKLKTVLAITGATVIGATGVKVLKDKINENNVELEKQEEVEDDITQEEVEEDKKSEANQKSDTVVLNIEDLSLNERMKFANMALKILHLSDKYCVKRKK